MIWCLLAPFATLDEVWDHVASKLPVRIRTWELNTRERHLAEQSGRDWAFHGLGNNELVGHTTVSIATEQAAMPLLLKRWGKSNSEND